MASHIEIGPNGHTPEEFVPGKGKSYPYDLPGSDNGATPVMFSEDAVVATPADQSSPEVPYKLPLSDIERHHRRLYGRVQEVPVSGEIL